MLERTGEHSYVIQMDEKRRQNAHRSQLKEYHHDEATLGPPIKLYHFKQSRGEAENSRIHECVIEKVVTHRRNEEGELEFLVQWEGSPERTWEPLQNFFIQYSQPLVSYFAMKGLKEDVMAHLAKHPEEAHVAVCEVIDELKKLEEESRMRWEEPPAEWKWIEDQKEAALDPKTQDKGSPKGARVGAKIKERWRNAVTYPREIPTRR